MAKIYKSKADLKGLMDFSLAEQLENTRGLNPLIAMVVMDDVKICFTIRVHHLVIHTVNRM